MFDFSFSFIFLNDWYNGDHSDEFQHHPVVLSVISNFWELPILTGLRGLHSCTENSSNHPQECSTKLN